jgi:AcrR family transcriptional regulator
MAEGSGVSMLKVKQQRSQDRRKKILRAATRVFGEKGVHGATLTAISRAAGVPLASLYDYFPDKTQLLAAIPQANFEEFYNSSDALIASMQDPVEQVEAFILHTLEYIELNPAWGRVFFLEIWPSALVRDPSVRNSVDVYGKRLIDILKAGIKNKSLARGIDPYLLMSVFLGSMTHLVAVWLLYGRPYNLSARGRKMLNLLLPTIERAQSVRRR